MSTCYMRSDLGGTRLICRRPAKGQGAVDLVSGKGSRESVPELCCK